MSNKCLINVAAAAHLGPHHVLQVLHHSCLIYRVDIVSILSMSYEYLMNVAAAALFGPHHVISVLHHSFVVVVY